MSVNPSPIAGFAGQFFDNNGQPLSGGKIFTYAAGTTTPQATYTSATGVTPHANPIVLDSAGRVPGGEIWLTDSLIYKFVIETSTNILIGTYDNITGVNSNFVNYTVQEEVITATAGQTVFNLTTINYTPGTNSLSVYIDGVNQYVGDSYLETDSDTVTFTAGLHVGAEVKFSTAVQVTTNTIDAANVSYDPPFANSVPTNVEDKLAQTVSVKDFGAVGDGVADDTAAIQAAIDSITNTTFATTWPGGVKNYSKGGGVVFLPPGRYRLTTGLLLGQHVRLQGSSTKGYFYPNGPDTTGSLLIADFADPNQWVISSANYNAAGARIGYRDVVTGVNMDNGVWNFTHGIEVRDLTIQAVSDCYGGIRLNGSPNATLDNIGVFDTDVGYLVNASWGVTAQRVFSITYLYGFAALIDVNGLDLNGYFDGQPGKTLNAGNRLNGIVASDFGPSVGLPNFANKKMGFVSYFTNTLNMRNVIVQHWEVACIHVQTTGLSNNSLYTEANTDALFATVTCSGVLNGMFQFNPALAGDAYFFGLNSNITLSGVPALGYSANNDTFSNVRIEQPKADTYGWEYSDSVTFLGAPTGVIQVSATGSATNIAYDASYTTLDEALRRIENSPIKKWRVIIKDGETVNVANDRLIDGKSITFEREGAGSNPTLRFVSGTGYPAHLLLRGDCDVRFQNVNIAYTAASSPLDPFDAAGLFIHQNASATISLTFDQMTVDLQTGWYLLQQGFHSASTVQAAFATCTINGSVDARIMGGAFNNEGQTNVISGQYDTTTALSVKAFGTNGWVNANVISSNF